MEVILLERINRLGAVGEKVRVRNGYARNYLLPQKKALRATEENVKYFETQRATLEKLNADSRAVAEKRAKGMQNLSITVVRQAAEDGKLYGSVTVRDVADALAAEGHEVERRHIDLPTAVKTLGVFEATIHLHPEVPVKVKVNVARNAESLLAQELAEEPATEAPASEDASGEEEVA